MIALREIARFEHRKNTLAKINWLECFFMMNEVERIGNNALMM